MTRTKNALLASLAGFTLLAAPLEAVVAPRSAAEKEFRNPGLTIPSLHTTASQFGSKSAAALPDLAGLGVPPEGAFYDPLAQRWASLLPSEPLIPGTGVGNQLSWAALDTGRSISPSGPCFAYGDSEKTRWGLKERIPTGPPSGRHSGWWITVPWNWLSKRRREDL